jgi:hypothetical protein
MTAAALHRDHLKGVAGHAGTPAYSNSTTVDADRKSLDRYAADSSGVMNQCVAFARRYWWDNKSILLPDLPMAAMIPHYGHVFRVRSGETAVSDPTQAAAAAAAASSSTSNLIIEKIPLVPRFNRKSLHAPVVGDLLITRARARNPPGHVAVIVKVDGSFVYTVDQNRLNHAFGEYQQRFPLQLDTATGCYRIVDDDEPVLAWVHVDAPDVPLSPEEALPLHKIAPRELGEKAVLLRRPWPFRDESQKPKYTDAEHSFASDRAIMDFWPHPGEIAIEVHRWFLVWPLLLPLRLMMIG